MRELSRLLHQHPSGVTLTEIAAHLRVTVRSARRYLESSGLEVEALIERPGGAKRWRIPPLDLPRKVAIRRSQAYALLATRALFDPLAGSSLHEEIDLASHTLLAVARRPGRGPNAGRADAMLEQRFVYLPFAPKDYRAHSEEVDNVYHAVSELHPLRGRYPHPETGQPERIKLHPYALLLYKDALHFLAYDCSRKCVRTFELDLLHNSRTLDDQHFTLPPGFCVQDYYQGHFGSWRGGETQTVIVHFDPRVAAHVATRSIHPNARMSPLDDGGLRMTIELGDTRELSRWVLGFGSMARVIAPEELKLEVAAELERALAHYQPYPASKKPPGKVTRPRRSARRKAKDRDG